MKSLILACLALSGACALAAGAPANAQALAAADTMALRVQACTLCHGREGRATNAGYFPRIAGKPAGYLYNQLVHFRDGRRQNAAMARLLEHLTDDYLREIAEHFASLDLPYPPPQTRQADAQTLERGRQLVQQGDAAGRIPSCTQCHGARMTGVLPAMPGLLGLPRDYLIGQLGAWRTGQRHAAAPDCMREVALRLTPDDVSAVATWLSAQPVPAEARPVAAAPGPWPLDCGSGTK